MARERKPLEADFKSTVQKTGYPDELSATTEEIIIVKGGNQLPFQRWFTTHINEENVLTDHELATYSKMVIKGEPTFEGESLEAAASLLPPGNWADENETSTKEFVVHDIAELENAVAAYENRLETLRLSNMQLEETIEEQNERCYTAEETEETSLAQVRSASETWEVVDADFCAVLISCITMATSTVELFTSPSSLFCQSSDDYKMAESRVNTQLHNLKTHLFNPPTLSDRTSSLLGSANTTCPDSNFDERSKDQYLTNCYDFARLKDNIQLREMNLIKENARNNALKAALTVVQSKLEQATMGMFSTDEDILKRFSVDLNLKRELLDADIEQFVSERLAPKLKEAEDFSNLPVVIGDHKRKISSQKTASEKMTEVEKALVEQTARVELLKMLITLDADDQIEIIRVLTSLITSIKEFSAIVEGRVQYLLKCADFNYQTSLSDKFTGVFSEVFDTDSSGILDSVRELVDKKTKYILWKDDTMERWLKNVDEVVSSLKKVQVELFSCARVLVLPSNEKIKNSLDKVSREIANLENNIAHLKSELTLFKA